MLSKSKYMGTLIKCITKEWLLNNDKQCSYTSFAQECRQVKRILYILAFMLYLCFMLLNFLILLKVYFVWIFIIIFISPTRRICLLLWRSEPVDYCGQLILLHVTEFHHIKGRSTNHFTLLLWIWTFLKFRYSFPFSLIHVFRFGHCNNCFISKYKVLQLNV